MNITNVPVIERRRFLQLSSAAVALAGLAPALLAADAKPARKVALRKAIMGGTIGYKGSTLEKFKAVKAAGFEGVEPGGGMDQDDVVKALDETGLLAASVCCHTHWAKPLSDANPAVREAGLDGLKLSLRDAKRYKAGSVLLVPGVVNKQVTYEQCWERSIAEIRKVIPLAEELGVVIAIENVWNDFITKEDEALRYLEEINSPWVKWHFDVGNIIWYGDPIAWINKLGKRISRLHIKEYSRDLAMKKGDKWKGFNVKFLDGANNWPGIMKAIEDIGYEGVWGIAEQGGGDSAEGLKDLTTRMDKMFAS